MSYTYAQAIEFVNHIAPIMQAEAKNRGYKIVSTAIAQAIVEGAAGTSLLAKYHNHFGLKCGSSWKGSSINLKTKEEYTTGVLTTISDNFRTYANDVEGVKGYYDFISTKRYANLKTAKSAMEYAMNLKSDGYATSSSYVNTLCSVVAKYNLIQYDDYSGIINSSYVIGQLYTLNANMYVRNSANGEKIPFESLTSNAKIHGFKDDNGYAILKIGTRVTCKDYRTLDDGSVWIRIPSGWVCAKNSKNIYIG